ncbi:MAG: hypothetical protein K2K23_05015 [Muribaculaceae bacterium]|nr:hypothetical protein [Muribaculaceae bacterium]
MRHIFLSFAVGLQLSILCLLGACSNATVPTGDVEDAGAAPNIIPDYTSIIIPPNIAPMNFEVDMPGEEYVARVSGAEGKSIVAGGNVIQWDMKEWKKLLEASKGKDIQYEVFVKNDGKWKVYKFKNHVADEPIDTHLSYRLIDPSFVQYSGMSINMRDLTSFDETIVYSTPNPCDERRGQCVNCHVPRNQYRDHSSQFHVRRTKSGTIVMAGDSVRKVNLKTDSTISAGVYPAWHPTLDLIAYSTNDTKQKIFSKGVQKVEVYDSSSDLILYDMKTHEVTNIANDPQLLETFPGWAPDGKRIYYSVARYPEGESPDSVPYYYDRMHYDIVSRDFDPATRRFSQPDTIVYASADTLSALLPRISPDGKYLLYCQAPFGTFHIWHKDSDLHMMDLASGETRPLTNANSPDTDSYHSWSSNSRWIVFSSRRDDGSYTRPYIAYISADGKDSKAFVVPQESPSYYRELMKSYNVPEFFNYPLDVSRRDIVRELDKDPIPAKFKSKL